MDLFSKYFQNGQTHCARSPATAAGCKRLKFMVSFTFKPKVKTVTCIEKLSLSRGQGLVYYICIDNLIYFIHLVYWLIGGVRSLRLTASSFAPIALFSLTSRRVSFLSPANGKYKIQKYKKIEKTQRAKINHIQHKNIYLYPVCGH